MKSKDFIKWSLESSFQDERIDLRDPKFVVVNDSLAINCFGVTYEHGAQNRLNLLFFVDRKADDIVLKRKTDVAYWPWSFSYLGQNGKWYSLAYSRSNEIFKLVSTTNFVGFSEECDFSLIRNYPNEARIIFHGHEMISLVRRDGTTLLGRASTDNLCRVNWIELPLLALGGPNMVTYKEKYLIISGRDSRNSNVHYEGNRTSIFLFNFEDQSLRRIGIVPSTGDTSYPGLHVSKDTVYMSYYTTRGNRGVINTAKLKLNF